jgi:Leucine-rich repeat (LRR) protein
MTSLTSLDLDTNQISGELPTEIGLLSQLSEL